MVKLRSIALLSLATAIGAIAVPSWWEQFSIKHRHLPSSLSHEPADHDLRLVQTSEDKAPFWTTEKQRLELIRNNVRFMDITDHQDLGVTTAYSAASLTHALPRNLSRQMDFQYYVKDLSKAYMEVVLTDFTKFHNRYYKSQYGLEAAQWLYKKVSDLIEESDASADVSLRKFKHDWAQFSIIARFEGKNDLLSNAPIIVGAHLDSINAWVPLLGRAPGADDDGSGTVLILDIFRVLIEKGFQPQRPVEFHWYSAEEAGLLGSQDVAASYKKKGVDVFAMLQNDQSGFVLSKDQEKIGLIVDYVDHDLTKLVKDVAASYKKKGVDVFAMLQNDQSGFVLSKDQEKIGLIVDYVDHDLTKLVKLYANEYTDLPVYEDMCGYACSDHASWTKAGYRAALATEEDFNSQCPYIHGEGDDLAHVDFDHMMQFARLNLGFIVELGNFKGNQS